MCKTQCLLALIALSINLVNSWDIAITNGDQLEFYTNKTISNYERNRFRALTALAYDAAYNMILFVDEKNDNASIFSYHLATKKYEPLVAKRPKENIQGIAFDPVTGNLFWTDRNEKSIFWTSLTASTPRTSIYGKLLLKMDDEIPRAIAVDSCRGYVYWTNVNITRPTIEMARFNGSGLSDRKVIVSSNIFSPNSLSIDQRTRRLYWADDKEGIYYAIESSDLEGKDRKTILHDTDHKPNALTVSNDSIYWIDGFTSIWKIPKNTQNAQPQLLFQFTDSPSGIVANYSVEDQTASIPECAPLRNVLQNKSVVNDSFNMPKVFGLFCLHGIKVDDKYSTCKCLPGYTGERCQISICQNYCLNGDCNVTEDGNPHCMCKPGFSGERCQTNVCENHCLNDGKCSFDGLKPTCKCFNDFTGDRCEMPKVEITTPTPAVLCNCSDTRNNSVLSLPTDKLSEDDGVYVDTLSYNAGWDPIRDPILMVLGILCGLLCLACAVLITKILQLKKRPRIKKRIIVNKNVTPLTARPDQCEITIENCCNMNICETPCFEPRNSIRPTLLDAKPGKEEKKNLIANMESADDFY